MKTEVLARDSLKSKQGVKEKSSLFGVLYDFLLFAAIPVAFEMSFVKIFQNSMQAYEVNDVVAMGRLIIYFTVQWFLGVLVRKEYLRSGLKRLTLVIMIMVQVKEAFFEEILIDMVISMLLESGFAILLFLKFAHLMVILKCIGLSMIMLSAMLYLKKNQPLKELKVSFKTVLVNMANFTHRIQNCIRMHVWYRYSMYCYRSYQPRLT